MLEIWDLGKAMHEMVDGDDRVLFGVEGCTVLSQRDFLKGQLLLEESLVIKFSGEGTSHRGVAELES